MGKTKTVQIKMTIGRNDLDRKMKQVIGFLEKGNSVRLTLYLYGRQKNNPDLGIKFLEKIYKEYLAEYKASNRPTAQNMALFFNAPRKQE